MVASLKKFSLLVFFFSNRAAGGVLNARFGREVGGHLIPRRLSVRQGRF